MLAPSAREIILEPPIPIAIPKAAIKKETGSTTLMAAMAMEPIQLPTKMESTKTFKDITKIPIEAGAACLISNFPMGSSPRSLEVILAMPEMILWVKNKVNGLSLQIYDASTKLPLFSVSFLAILSQSSILN